MSSASVIKARRCERRGVGTGIVWGIVRRNGNAAIAGHVYAGCVVIGMNRIMITGSTGIIGRRAVHELLAADNHATGVTRSARGRERLERLGEPQPVDHGTNREEVAAWRGLQGGDAFDRTGAEL